MRIKVLHILHGFGTGGAETWLLEVARYVQKHPELNLHIDFLLTGGEKAVLDEEIIKAGAGVFYIKYSFGRLFFFKKAFIELLHREKYNALHDHEDFISGWHFLLGWKALPAIRISHLHNPYNYVRNYVNGPVRWLSFKIGRLLMSLLATKITGTSNAVMDEYGYGGWPYRSKRISPAYCGFDMKTFLYDQVVRERFFSEMKWDSDNRIALFVGRIGLHPSDTAINQKNPDFAFRLAKYLTTQDQKWKFLFVGYKGEVGERLERETQSLGLSDRIYFTGLRRDVSVLMSSADVLVFPSFWEGLGMVVVEAQSNGLPVLASDSIPAEATIIPDLVTKLSLKEPLVKWYNAIQSISTNGTLRAAYNEKAGATPFSIEESVKNLLCLYLSPNPILVI